MSQNEKELKQTLVKQHSRLSPSTASIWLNSTASPYLWELWPNVEQEEEYADDGTKAHWYGEQILKGQMEIKDLPVNYEEVKVYVDTVLSIKGAEGNMMVEVNTEMTDLLESPEPITGTSDCVIIQPDLSLDIVDLKWGMGVKVAAVDNPQAQMYAVGVINFLSTIGILDLSTYPKDTRITVHIIQPRFSGNEYSFHNLTFGQILEFIEFAKGKIKEIFSGNGVFTEGEHSRFDKATPHNPVYTQQVEEVAALPLDILKEVSKEALAKYEIISEKDLMKLYGMKSTITKFYTSLEKYLTAQILASLNGEYMGYKLMEVPGDREVVDEKALEQQFIAKGAPADVLKISKLVGMKDLDKLAKQYGIAPSELAGLGRKSSTKIVSAEDYRDALFGKVK